MENPITYKEDGTAEWIHQDGDMYIATGVDTRGRRFKPIRSHLWAYINGINLYKGTKWLERNGKRYTIQKVWN